jgi:hypothetical protein
MQKKQRNRLKESDKEKIRSRFESKLEEFKQLPLDTLKDMYQNTKMSHTDKFALVRAKDFLMKEAMIKHQFEMNNGSKKEDGGHVSDIIEEPIQ